MASPDGLFSRQDKVIITSGRAARPARPDEIVATTQAAAVLGLHVGSQLRVGLVDDASGSARKAGEPALRARLRLTVVGIG